MRTLKEMIARVKVLVRGSENLTWRDDDYERSLVEAARLMWRNIANGVGARILRTYSDPTVYEDAVFRLPEDCLRLEEVMVYREINGHSELKRLQYLKPPIEDGPFIFISFGQGWTDDRTERQVRLVNIPQDTEIVIQYLQEPVFPFYDNGTLRRPSGEGEETYPNLPDICDAACEYLAAALMLGEEVKDDVPIGYNGSQYSGYMSLINKSVAVQPARRYVRRVSRR